MNNKQKRMKHTANAKLLNGKTVEINDVSELDNDVREKTCDMCKTKTKNVLIQDNGTPKTICTDCLIDRSYAVNEVDE